MLSLFDKLPKHYSQSPFPYFGRKKKALKHILSLIPEDINSLVSPFMGGGAVELAVASCGVSVKAADNYQNLVDCWKTLKSGPVISIENIAEIIKQFYEECLLLDTKAKKEKHFREYFVKTDYKDAKKNAIHFLLRQYLSFNRQGCSIGVDVNSLPDLNKAGLRLQKILQATTIPKSIEFECADFEQFLQNHTNSWSYIDPPYFNFSSIYGNMEVSCKNFNHLKLATLLKKRGRWILSYNNNFNTRGYYSRFRKLNVDIVYGPKVYKELLVVSDEVPDELLKKWNEEHKSNVSYHPVVDVAPIVEYNHDYILAKVAKIVGSNVLLKGEKMRKKNFKKNDYLCIESDEGIYVINTTVNVLVGKFTSLSAAAKDVSGYDSVSGPRFWGQPV